jgi:hypothetical protein
MEDEIAREEGKDGKNGRGSADLQGPIADLPSSIFSPFSLLALSTNSTSCVSLTRTLRVEERSCSP